MADIEQNRSISIKNPCCGRLFTKWQDVAHHVPRAHNTRCSSRSCRLGRADPAESIGLRRIERDRW